MLTRSEASLLRDRVLNSTPHRFKSSFVACLYGLRGFPEVPDPVEVVDEVADIFSARLTPDERAFLLMATAQCVEPEFLNDFSFSVCASLSMGAPFPPFDPVRQEARDWSALASLQERRTYFATVWGTLGDADRARFLKAVKPKRWDGCRPPQTASQCAKVVVVQGHDTERTAT